MQLNEEGFDDVMIAVDFYPNDKESAELLARDFVDEEIFESKAFSGDWIYTVIISAAVGSLGKVLKFFSTHRERFKDAVVKIGKNEISLTGYSMSEIEKFFDNDNVQNALREIKKK